MLNLDSVGFDQITKASFADLGASVLPGSVAEFENLVKDETDKWGKGDPGCQHQGRMKSVESGKGHERLIDDVRCVSGVPPIASQFVRWTTDKGATAHNPTSRPLEPMIMS